MLKEDRSYRLVREVASDALLSVHEAVSTVASSERVWIVSGKLPQRASVLDAAQFAEEVMMSQDGLPHGLVPVFEHGAQHGLPFVVHRHFEARALARNKKLPVEAAAVLAHDIAVALRFAQSSPPPLVHRMLTAASILITPAGNARLVGTGLGAVALGGARQNPHLAALAGRYWSPEFVADGTATPACDVYGLAVVLYEALGNTVPPAGARTLDPKAVVAALLKQRDVPASLARILPPMFDATPSERPTVDEVVDELEAAAGDFDASRRTLAAQLDFEAGDAALTPADPVPMSATTDGDLATQEHALPEFEVSERPPPRPAPPSDERSFDDATPIPDDVRQKTLSDGDFEVPTVVGATPLVADAFEQGPTIVNLLAAMDIPASGNSPRSFGGGDTVQLVMPEAPGARPTVPPQITWPREQRTEPDRIPTVPPRRDEMTVAGWPLSWFLAGISIAMFAVVLAVLFVIVIAS
ncbi:MAG: protein kinase [Sandaracinaceae bacterium]